MGYNSVGDIIGLSSFV